MGQNKVYAPPQGKYSSNLGKVGEYQRQYSGCNLNIHIFDFGRKIKLRRLRRGSYLKDTKILLIYILETI